MNYHPLERPKPKRLNWGLANLFVFFVSGMVLMTLLTGPTPAQSAMDSQTQRHIDMLFQGQKALFEALTRVQILLDQKNKDGIPLRPEVQAALNQRDTILVSMAQELALHKKILTGASK